MNQALTMDNTALIKRLAIIALIFIAAAVVVSTMQKKEASLAKEVIIEVTPLREGHSFIDNDDIKVSIQRSFGYDLEGLPLGSVDIERLERVLEEDPFILDAEAYIDGRNRIHIEVEQREPILRIIDNNGLNYYLDGSGFKMPLSKHFAARVLVASGNIPPHVPDFKERDKHVLKDLYELTSMILADDFFKALIEQIHVSNRGEFTLAPKVGRQKILFGTFTDAEEKFENLKIFYNEALPYEGWRKYQTIDLRYKGQVVCKKR
jgi:cell division protein FtsQ